MAAVPRRDKPRHLDAALVPLEHALRARADALEVTSANTPGGNELYLFVAAEFRDLASELHHW